MPIQELQCKLETLPPGLKGFYEYISQDLRDKLPDDILKKSKTILIIVGAASTVHPLTLQGLWDAVAIPKNTQDAFRNR